MSGFPLLNPYENALGRARSASSSQHIDDQIDVLRRQTAAAIGKGNLSAERGADIAGRLNDIQTAVDTGIADRSMTRSDLREIGRTLHEIRMLIVQANRAGAEAANAAGPGDKGSGNAAPRALDLTV